MNKTIYQNFTRVTNAQYEVEHHTNGDIYIIEKHKKDGSTIGIVKINRDLLDLLMEMLEHAKRGS